MIFYHFQSHVLDKIDLTVDYHSNEIDVHVRWSPSKEAMKWTIAFLDDECTLPNTSPTFYLCSSSINPLVNPTFYSYWFLLETCFYRRLFSHLVENEDQPILLVCLADGRILALAEWMNKSVQDSSTSIIWYSSSSSSPMILLGVDYDLNTNLLDAVLASTNVPAIGTKTIVNHLLICESIGSLVILTSTSLRRILLDNSIRSACLYANQFVYITRNEIRSISISALLRSSKEEILSQSQVLRLGHFEKLLVDGQEIVLYYQNGTFERLKTLLARSTPPSRLTSISNQTKKLVCLTTTIAHLQTNASLLQRWLTKVDSFYQLKLTRCLQFVDQQWKLLLTEAQARIFQTSDFLLVLLCQFSSTEVRTYQLLSNNQWTFPLTSILSRTSLCQPVLVLRHQSECHFQLGGKQIVLPFDEDLLSTTTTKPPNLSSQQYHLIVTLRNEAAGNYKKRNLHLPRRMNIGRTHTVGIECKQQDIKVDTDAGLVDTMIIQIVLSSICLRRLMLVFSRLCELFDSHEKVDEKHFIKQIDLSKVTDLIENLQQKISNASMNEETLLDLLQIRLYLSMFRLGSNYTVQVY